jgi:hypothetical protein
MLEIRVCPRSEDANALPGSRSAPNRKYGSWQPLYRATYHTPESFGTLVVDQE